MNGVQKQKVSNVPHIDSGGLTCQVITIYRFCVIMIHITAVQVTLLHLLSKNLSGVLVLLLLQTCKLTTTPRLAHGLFCRAVTFSPQKVFGLMGKAAKNINIE